MDSAEIQNEIQSELFEKYMQQNHKLLNSLKNEEFIVPAVFKNIAFVYYIYNKHLEVLWKNIPDSTIYIDPKKEDDLKNLDEIIKRDTEGFLTELSSSIKSDLRSPMFRDLVLGTLYLKGMWGASKAGEKPFYNLDETIVRIPFFKFRDITVIVKDKLLTARRNYITQKDLRAKYDIYLPEWDRHEVCFSMPYDGVERVYSNAELFVPEVDISYKKGWKDSRGKTVMEYRYKHDEKGFTAACVYSCDSAECCIENYYKFVLDKPFFIQIFYKKEELFKISINNLK